jgi:hypothetical protein
MKNINLTDLYSFYLGLGAVNDLADKSFARILGVWVMLRELRSGIAMGRA